MSKSIRGLLPTFVLVFACCVVAWSQDINTAQLQKEIQGLRDSLVKYQKIQIENAATLSALSNLKKIISPQSFWDLLVKSGAAVLLLVTLIYLLGLLVNKLNPKWYLVLIQRLVERYEEVNVLKRKKKILLLSPPDAKNIDFLDNLLEEFNIVEKMTVTDAYVAPKQAFDVIFANFETGILPQEILHQYLNDNFKALICLCPPVKWDFTKNLEINKRVSLVNARAQIYGNLVSLLKFQDKISPKIIL